MCQNQRATKKLATASQSVVEPPRLAIGGRAEAISGAARSMRIMCCAIRALNKATDSAHSGEMNAAAATIQPAAARRLSVAAGTRATWAHVMRINVTTRIGSRLNRLSNSPGIGAEPL